MAKSRPKRKIRERKMSEALLQFSEPLLADVEENESEENLQVMFQFLWNVWNAVVVADANNDESVLEVLRESMAADPDMEEILAAMIERKRLLFGNDQRLIGEIEVVLRDGQMHLRVEAFDPVAAPPLDDAQPKTKAQKSGKQKSTKQPRKKSGPRCGLCGKTKNLIQTDCCGNWICDDEHTYELFSYARSCSRNHSRYTLCGFHFNEGHAGDWKECPQCRDSFETEMYVYYGTNEYNFEVLPDPPAYEPTRCADCGTVIILGDGGYSQSGNRYWCAHCTAKHMNEGR